MPQTRLEYRARWTTDQGGHVVEGGTLLSVEMALAGFAYEKPDLSYERRTVTVGDWEAIEAATAEG